MLNQSNSLFKNLFLTDLVFIGLGAIAWLFFTDITHVFAILTALLLTSIYAVIGLWYINTYFDAPTQVFMSKVYGAVALRLSLLASCIFIVLKFTNLPEITFTVSVFISYLAKSIQEILFIHRKSAKT